MWNIKTPISKRLELLGDRGGSGGTDIPGNTISVTKLKKPYYYDNGENIQLLWYLQMAKILVGNN